jgi:hypothetical protein
MSVTTGIWSNCELIRHSAQSAWASAGLCRETSVDRATDDKQIWPVSWNACFLSALAASVVVTTAMPNYTAVLQIPIAA